MPTMHIMFMMLQCTKTYTMVASQVQIKRLESTSVDMFRNYLIISELVQSLELPNTSYIVSNLPCHYKPLPYHKDLKLRPFVPSVIHYS